MLHLIKKKLKKSKIFFMMMLAVPSSISLQNKRKIVVFLAISTWLRLYLHKLLKNLSLKYLNQTNLEKHLEKMNQHMLV